MSSYFTVTSFYLTIVGVQRYCCTWSHSVTHTHSVRHLYRKDRPVTKTDNKARGAIRTRDPSKKDAADPRLRSLG
jgi:hypothetical protein